MDSRQRVHQYISPNTGQDFSGNRLQPLTRQQRVYDINHKVAATIRCVMSSSPCTTRDLQSRRIDAR
ncbi:hypothetical protein TNCV_739641 [Trichonephila clavipes]|nr:hypothetical protein TNCV_739641 [Trichonephila clavipes]